MCILAHIICLSTMQDRNSAREDFDDIYFDRLMEKYEATQRERELVRRGICHNLYAFLHSV